jgi:hypothetical protein
LRHLYPFDYSYYDCHNPLPDQYNPMASFNIVLVDPTGMSTTRGLHDVARLLFFSFESLGHRVTLQTNSFDPAATNIVIGYERLPPDAIPPGVRYIPYQLEQMSTEGANVTPLMIQILRSAAEIWDYNPQNAQALAQLGVRHVKLLPLGFHDKLATIPPAVEDIDVLFYGMMNPRRMNILEQIAGLCSVRHLQFVYGPDRDAWISRAKLVVNIHFYEAKVAEQVRVSYLLNNRRCVVSETSQWDPLADLCVTAPYEHLAQTCIDLVKNALRRLEIARSAFERFRQRPMTEYLRQVL